MTEYDETMYVEADEEITSVVDKLHKAAGKEITLVIPRGAMVLQSLVNLKLLKREATHAKKNIGVVTADTIGRNLVVQAGIKILESVKSKRVLMEPDAEHAPEMPKEADLRPKEKPPVSVHHFQERAIAGTPSVATRDIPPPPALRHTQTVLPPARRRKRLIVGAVLAVLVLIGLLVVLPSAQVTLAVTGEPYERELEIEITTSERVPSIEQSNVPGEFVEDTIEVKETFQTSGKKDVGDKATGAATISNDAGVDQTLNQGTKLTGGSLVFVTTGAITIPKATLNSAGDKVQGKATVNVEASQAGDRYNVSGLTVSVPVDKLTGRIDSTSGGLTREVTVVSAEDIAAAKSTLEKKATDELTKRFAEKSKKVVMEGALQLEAKDTKSSAAEGAEASQFEQTIAFSAKALVFQEGVFRETFVAILRQGLPPGKDLVLSASDEIVTQVGDVDFTSGTMIVKGAIKTQLVPQLSTGVLRKQLVNKSPQKAADIADDLTDVQRVEIETSPRWWKRLPLMAARINVVVEHE